MAEICYLRFVSGLTLYPFAIAHLKISYPSQDCECFVRLTWISGSSSILSFKVEVSENVEIS